MALPRIEKYCGAPPIDGTPAALGELREVTFLVAPNAILQVQGVLTKTVNGYEGFAEFSASNNTATTVLPEEVVFNWEVTYIGIDATHGNATGSNRSAVTDSITIYTVLDIPRTPWNTSDDPTTDDTSQPWVAALEFATAPTKASASGTDAQGALAAITSFLFRHSKDTDGDGQIDVYGHDVVYACRDGDPEYAYFHAGLTWSINLTGYMSKQWGNTVNCYDQAAGIAILGLLLGLDVEFCYMHPFGYINPTPFVGIDGECNNPFFRRDNPPQAQLVDHDAVEPDRTFFGNHAFCRYNGLIYDACAGPNTGTPQMTYLANTIDRSTSLEVSDPRYGRIAGDASDIVVVRYDPSRGIT